MTEPSQLAYRQYQKALRLWPKDNLRPGCQIQDAVARRVETTFAAGQGAAEQKELAQANAMHALLENRFAAKVSRQAPCNIDDALCKVD